MSENIKFILNELNKSPYNKNYNLISFDSLGTEDRLQASINWNNRIDTNRIVSRVISLHDK